MNRPTIVFLLAVAVAASVLNVSGQAPEKPQSGFLAAFKGGESVNVKEVAGRFEITSADDGLTVLSHKITEIGSDYITVEDLAGVSETRIPIYAIKGLVKLKLPK